MFSHIREDNIVLFFSQLSLLAPFGGTLSYTIIQNISKISLVLQLATKMLRLDRWYVTLHINNDTITWQSKLQQTAETAVCKHCSKI